MTKLEAIDKTLNEKWIPISEAKSKNEIKQICIHNTCYFRGGDHHSGTDKGGV